MKPVKNFNLFMWSYLLTSILVLMLLFSSIRKNADAYQTAFIPQKQHRSLHQPELFNSRELEARNLLTKKRSKKKAKWSLLPVQLQQTLPEKIDNDYKEKEEAEKIPEINKEIDELKNKLRAELKEKIDERRKEKSKTHDCEEELEQLKRKHREEKAEIEQKIIEQKHEQLKIDQAIYKLKQAIEKLEKFRTQLKEWKREKLEKEDEQDETFELPPVIDKVLDIRYKLGIPQFHQKDRPPYKGEWKILKRVEKR